MASFTRTSRAPREERRDEVLRGLGEAVERLLADGTSYAELSVDRIVAEAGISRSSFYRHIADKGRLLQLLARDVDHESGAQWIAIWQLAGDATRAEFDDACEHLVIAAWKHRRLRGAFVEATGYDPSIREQHERLVELAASILADHVRLGQREGYVRAELDADDIALWLAHMTDHGMVNVIDRAAQADLRRVSNAFAGVCWAALYGDQRDPSGHLSRR